MESSSLMGERALSMYPFHQPNRVCRALLAPGLKQNMTGPVVDKNAEGARCQLIDLKFARALNVSVEGYYDYDYD